MKIEGLHSEKRGDRTRVAATVKWEDCDRPAYELYFETGEAFAEDLSCNPHAFLTGSIIPAMHYGEERISLDEEICPTLRDGLLTVMGWFRHWYYRPDRKLVRIEARVSSGAPRSPNRQRAGFFFSGGIDSLGTLLSNRLRFPATHPGSIKDGLLVFGLELDSPVAFQYLYNSVSNLAAHAGILLIPVYTNVYLIYRKDDAKSHFNFWGYQMHAAAMAAVAHALHRRLDLVYIAGDTGIASLTLAKKHYPDIWGTHPLIDYNYSSSDLLIRHDGLTLTRFEKTRMIAESAIPLAHLRVCNHYKQYKPGIFNCSRCEKCLRTMLALLALNKLKESPAFSVHDISSDFFHSVFRPKKENSIFYLELLQPLKECGRHDLVHAVTKGLDKIKSLERKEMLKSNLRSLDKKCFEGYFTKIYKSTLRKRAHDDHD